MVFPSVEFAVFFPVVLGLSWRSCPTPARGSRSSLAASYVFYAAADARSVAAGRASRSSTRRAPSSSAARPATAAKNAIVAVDRRRSTCSPSVFFKYYGFFVSDFDELLDDVGLGRAAPLLTVALPVGLSFFTFQAISYVVDVRRGLCERATTIDLAIYLSFFPHLVAGPIVRAREFLPQLARRATRVTSRSARACCSSPSA